MPHFYYGIVLTLQNQVIYATRAHKMMEALVATGKRIAFRQHLRKMEPQLDLKAEIWPDAQDERSEYFRSLYVEEEKSSHPFTKLVEDPWPMLADAVKEFSSVLRNGPDELKNTAAYNLAQVYARRGDAESLRLGVEVLEQISLGRLVSDDDKALKLQIEVLLHSIRARYLIETGGSRHAFDASWNSLQEKWVAIKTSGLPSGYEVDLRADYLIKSGYVLYDQATHDRFTDSPPDALNDAAVRFAGALSVRKSWNQAQLYLAITRAIQCGVAVAQFELAAEVEELEPPATDFANLLKESNDLFDSLLGKAAPTEVTNPHLSEAEALLKAARDFFKAVQAKDDEGEDDENQTDQSKTTREDEG
jgi:hypothetical protein